MRNLMVVVALSCAALAQNHPSTGPVVCVSTVQDNTGKAIGPLGDLNYELAQIITDHKPLQGSALTPDIDGDLHPSSECDYLLKVTLHVGNSTGVALNPPKPNILDPGVDPRHERNEWLVEASYQLTSLPKSGTKIQLEDRNKDRYDPNVGGVNTDLASVAKRAAHTAASNAAGKLKKKLKL